MSLKFNSWSYAKKKSEVILYILVVFRNPKIKHFSNYKIITDGYIIGLLRASYKKYCTVRIFDLEGFICLVVPSVCYDYKNDK